MIEPTGKSRQGCRDGFDMASTREGVSTQPPLQLSCSACKVARGHAIPESRRVGDGPQCGVRFSVSPGSSFVAMDHDRRKADGAPGQVDNIPMPTGRRGLLSTWPVATVFIIGFPIFVWWRYDVLSDHRLVTFLVTFAYYMLVILAFGRTRAPLPEPANQFSRERVKWTLSEAPRTATVPEDPDLRIAIGVAAVSRIRSAAFTSIFALTLATPAWCTRRHSGYCSEQSWE